MNTGTYLHVVRLFATDEAFRQELSADPTSALQSRGLAADPESLSALMQVAAETDQPDAEGIRWWRHAVGSEVIASSLAR